MKNLYDVWQDYWIPKKLATQINYQDAFTRFVKDNGTIVKWEDIDESFVQKWKNKMLTKGLSKTTVNMYMRNFSAVLHFAYQQKLYKVDPKLVFHSLNIYSLNSSLDRKDRYLPIEVWTKLWIFFLTNGKEIINFQYFQNKQRKNILEAVGIMLFMYLGNGMNLIDLCKLKYSHNFFDSNQPILNFVRTKTANRSDANVFFPVTNELFIIINRCGCLEKSINHYVFPYFMETKGEMEQRKKLMQVEKFICKYMKYVAELFCIPQAPTPTWARHSFATNLIQNGVPKDYVAAAMGHTNTNVTNHYVAEYSFAQMVDYNSILLHKKERKHNDLVNQLCKLSTHDFLELLKTVCHYRLLEKSTF